MSLKAHSPRELPPYNCSDVGLIQGQPETGRFAMLKRILKLLVAASTFLSYYLTGCRCVLSYRWAEVACPSYALAN